MLVLSDLTPTNILEEKALFEADNTYNPQFKYQTSVSPLEWAKYGLPQAHYLELAQEIVDQAYHQYSEAELRELRGVPISQAEADRKLHQFLEMHQLEQRFKISWSASYIARTSINADTIKLRLPVDYRDQEFLGVIYHEVGTHALRRINYERQPFYKKRKKYGLDTPYLVTEEGLAVLHSLLPMEFKSAYSAALRYLFVDKAQRSSFAETYQLVRKYVQDPDRAWTTTFRQKRGLTDTSQPGGFTKDQVYFQGMVEVWNYLEKNEFDISQLYWGKIAYQDLDTAVKINPNFQPVLPSFFEASKERYQQQVWEIGQKNFLPNFS